MSPELETIVEALRAGASGPPPGLAELRAAADAIADTYPPPDATVVDPVEAAGVSGEWLTPADVDGDRALLYLHGGGYVMGSARGHRGLAGRVAQAMRARSLTLDYRLAPEHPFPAALDDAVGAYRHLLDRGHGSGSIVVAGDSSGGGLAMALAVRARSEHLPLPGAIVCLSPWLDLECAGESMITNADRDPLISRSGLQERARQYLPEGDLRDPLVSPVHADLRGLPPILIQVSSHECLFDDATRLAQRAQEASVDVVLDARPDVVHVWQLFAPAVPEATDAIAAIGRFVDDTLSGAGRA